MSSIYRNEASATPAPPPGAMPNETVRTLITLGLLFHLFVAIVAAAATGRAHSEMVERLYVKLVTPLVYPDVLRMARRDLQFTYNMDTDSDTRAEIVLDWPAGGEQSADRVANLKTIPVANLDEMRLAIRRHRYLSLAASMSNAVGQDANEMLLPDIITRSLVAEHDIPDGKHRFRLWRLPTAEPSWVQQTGRREPQLALEADLTVLGGRASVTKAESSRLSSPVDRRGQTGSANGQPPVRPAPAGQLPNGQSLNGQPPLVPPLIPIAPGQLPDGSP